MSLNAFTVFIFLIIFTCTKSFILPAKLFLKAKGNYNPILLRATTDVSIDVSAEELSERVINISPKAMAHIISLKSKSVDGENTCLRMAVRAGGCSGMSYAMDMISPDKITDDDHVEVYEGIR